MHFWTAIWGSFFVLLGLSMILKAFGVNFPFFRLAVACLIIFIGLKILLPGKFGGFTPPQQTGRETMFAESVLSGPDVKGEYSVVFGSSKMDLTGIELKDETVKIKLDTVFAGSEIKIDTKKPVKITATAVFGGVSLPNGAAAAFGTGVYTSDTYKEGQPHIQIEVNAVFGGVEIR